jgi:Transposase DDE domain
LPKSLKSRPRTMAIDMHNKPFYGDKKTPGTYRGQPKASTKTFFAYATLLVIRKGQTFTVGLVSIVNSDPLTSIIDQLLGQAALQGLRPRRLLLDRGFYAAKVMLHLQQQNLPFVMPMIRRGQSGTTKKACTGTAQFFVKGRKGWVKYRWEARLRTGGRKGPKGPRTAVTTDVCMVPRPGGQGKTTPWVFACHGMNGMAGTQVAALYRRRFRIETSYRQMHEGLAQTCSKDPVYRLLLVLIAFVLRNLWVWLHWTLLAGRDNNGKRVLRLYLMRARRMLHCLVRYLDYKLGTPKNIDIPSPAATAAYDW